MRSTPNDREALRETWLEGLHQRLHEAADAMHRHVKNRLEVGAREYGDRSFDRPLHEVLGEIMDEHADLLGWQFISYVIEREQQMHEQGAAKWRP